MTFTIDIEPTNRCNAKCHFCPRDQTPHQGLMTPETFRQSLDRAIEYRALAEAALGEEKGSVDAISLCGLGEPLLNKHTPDFVRQVREAGFTCQMSSNGALLDERRGQALLDAGLQRVFLNIGDRDADYEAVYQLPFERTLENVKRFLEMAGDQCEVWIVLVDNRRDAEHVEAMREFWRGHGVKLFQDFAIMNRGGALYVDHMQFETLPQLQQARTMLASRGGTPLCGAPFGYLFVGYDGQYYLCCSDWKKEVPLGSVFDRSFADVTAAKLRHVSSRASICKTCNLDPINRLTDELRATDAGEAAIADLDGLADDIASVSGYVESLIDAVAPGTTALVASEDAPPERRYIPVNAL